MIVEISSLIDRGLILYFPVQLGVYFLHSLIFDIHYISHSFLHTSANSTLHIPHTETFCHTLYHFNETKITNALTLFQIAVSFPNRVKLLSWRFSYYIFKTKQSPKNKNSPNNKPNQALSFAHKGNKCTVFYSVKHNDIKKNWDEYAK